MGATTAALAGQTQNGKTEKEYKMPRGRLSEKYVQDAAIKWLVYHYQKKQIYQAVICQKEVGVSRRSKWGYGRADGLIVAQHSDGKFFTASLEAKSSRTFFNIIPWYKDERWVIHAFMVGMTTLILAGMIAWFLGGGWFWVWVFPLIVFVVVGIGYLLITSDFSYYRPINVVAQVKGYPANEQWIAISTDVFNQLGAEGERALRKDCQKEGIGIVRISASEKTTSLMEPKARKLPKGCEDFLECYTRGRSLRKRLQLEIEKVQLQDVLQNEDE